MAPLKTMAHSQQEQTQPQTNHRLNQGGDQACKPRKRKGNKQQSNNNNLSAQPSHRNENLQTSRPQKQQVNHDNSSNKQNAAESQKQTTSAKLQQTPKINKTIVAADRAISRNKEENTVPTKPVKEVKVPTQLTTVLPVKQLSTEEPDDIDAGIELDGSSNSGSSVKDINEDQAKSASVSPVMAQSNVERDCSNNTKHAVEMAPVEQITGSICSDIGAAGKKASTTKQQLAANQQVIDADEQLLQEKLQIKQRRSSLKGSLNTSIASNVSTNTHNASSNNSVSSPSSPGVCKICALHVYQMERILAEKSAYHKGCFRCYQCKVQLRVDNYSSHEGQVYCKAHHRQLFQPQVKLDNEDDVDIVAKSTSKVVDEYLLQRGRLSELSFSFLKPKPEEIRKRQMIICENEPVELPNDVIRCNTKVDDGIDRLNINLYNIMERFERGAQNGEDSQPSSAGIVIEKPSFDIKKTLMAFETNAVKSSDEVEDADSRRQERPERTVVKKLSSNLSSFLNRQNSNESEPSQSAVLSKPLALRRSESLLLRLKKYESRINGEQISDDAENDDVDDSGNLETSRETNKSVDAKRIVPKKLTSLKNQWENGDISKRRVNRDVGVDADSESNVTNGNNPSDSINGNSPLAEKNEELIRIRQQLARKKSGESASVKNIYENAIKEAQQQQQRAPKLNSSDLSALNGFSTIEIQQQLLQNGNNHNTSTPSTPMKDHFQLNLSNKANKLKERFELGLVKNNSLDDSDASQGDDEPQMTRMEQLRQEKLEDLSIFTEGEIKAREARSMFQQIDRRLSAANSASGSSRNSLVSSSRSPASISASMSSRIQSKIQQSAKNTNGVSECASGDPNTVCYTKDEQIQQQQPIRLTNNVRT